MGRGVALGRFRFCCAHPCPLSRLQIIREEHASIAAVLRSLQALVGRAGTTCPRSSMGRPRFFLIDKFPEREHHPKESTHLAPLRCARRAHVG